jgi:serine/threonine protein kinase
MLYELLCGQTPFHSYEMKDLVAKINKGDYLVGLKEPILIECALFLTQCLQANEADRITADEIVNHPFLKIAALDDDELITLDKVAYEDELIRLSEIS